MPVITMKRYNRAKLRAHPDWLFVFGDNMDRSGYGGQARACRGEPNAVGIPTKWGPSMDEGAFFTDDSFIPLVKPAIDAQILLCGVRLLKGGTVVLPEDGVGTGLAQLPKRAPLIAAYIDDRLALLRSIPSLV
jgi:hypothetical protein